MKKIFLGVIFFLITKAIISNPIAVQDVTRFEDIGFLTSIFYLIFVFLLSSNIEYLVIGKSFYKILNKSIYKQIIVLNFSTFIPTQIFAFYIHSKNYINNPELAFVAELIPLLIEPFVVFKILKDKMKTTASLKLSKVITIVILANLITYILGIILNFYLDYSVDYRQV